VQKAGKHRKKFVDMTMGENRRELMFVKQELSGNDYVV
jgi:hypothetical protein